MFNNIFKKILTLKTKVTLFIAATMTILFIINNYLNLLSNLSKWIIAASESYKAKTTKPLLANLGNTQKTAEKNIDENIDCSNIEEQWRADENSYIEGNKIKLISGADAGSIFLKDFISEFLNFEIGFKSFLNSGINTNLAFKNRDGELRYSIGDGDFRTIRYSYGGNLQKTILPEEIDNNQNIGFRLSIQEQSQKNKVISALTYFNKAGQQRAINLNDIEISNAKSLYLIIGFGLDAGKELEKNKAYIKIESCHIKEIGPSKILNI